MICMMPDCGLNLINLVLRAAQTHLSSELHTTQFVVHSGSACFEYCLVKPTVL